MLRPNQSRATVKDGGIIHPWTGAPGVFNQEMELRPVRYSSTSVDNAISFLTEWFGDPAFAADLRRLPAHEVIDLALEVV